jgi:adenylate kinase family enzyme
MSASTEEPRPLLVLERGKPGFGKTTLARRLGESDALGLPVLPRDAIKVGLVETRGSRPRRAGA